MLMIQGTTGTDDDNQNAEINEIDPKSEGASNVNTVGEFAITIEKQNTKHIDRVQTWPRESKQCKNCYFRGTSGTNDENQSAEINEIDTESDTTGTNYDPESDVSSKVNTIGDLAIGVKGLDIGENSMKQIYRVQTRLRESKEYTNCCDPLVVSIGPYHFGKKKLKEFEKLKIPIACKLHGNYLPEKHIDRIDPEVEKECENALGYYEKDSIKSFKKFNMFLDACFVLYFILFSEKDEVFKFFFQEFDVADAGLNKNYYLVLRDLFLLENQIPLSVIKALMESLKTDLKKEISKFIVDFSQLLVPRPADFMGSSNETEQGLILNLDSDGRPRHLLRLVGENLMIPGKIDTVGENLMIPGQIDTEHGGRRINFRELYRSVDNLVSAGISFIRKLDTVGENLMIPGKIDTEHGGRRINLRESYRSVTDLISAGIYFKPSKTQNLADVKFKSYLWFGILTLPSIKVDHLTKPLLLNLLAYEMCPHGPLEMRIASYICLMDSLIDHADDVKELRKKRIIVNKLGSDEDLAQLFNEIANNLVPVNDPHEYVLAKWMIGKHCKSIRYIWIAEWVHKNFSSPLTLMAFLGALLILALTMTQTFFSAYPRSTSKD